MPRRTSLLLHALVLALTAIGVVACELDDPGRARSDRDDPAWGASARAALEAATPAAAPTRADNPLPTQTALPTPTDPPTSTPDPFLASGAPSRLSIPAIGVDAAIESVGLTDDRAMGVPQGWMNVGWYNQGYRPGEVGNSVIAGHLDTNTGGPAIFWSLDKLQPGDEVNVWYENGDHYVFVVDGAETYGHDAEGEIIDRIFGESLTSDLNLVTCDGAWDHGQATYTHRLVVFTTLVPERSVRADGTPMTLQ